MSQAQIKAVITAEDRASQTLKQFGNNVGGVKGRLQEMAPTFAKMAAFGTAAFAAISFGIGKAVKAAANAEQIERNFGIVFKNTAGDMDKFVKEFAKQFGRAETAVRSATTSMGSMLGIATTLGQDVINDLTKEFVHSAEALAFYDPKIRDAEHAMEGFSNAVAGNTQQLRFWGFDINEARIEEKALEMGLSDGTGKLDRNTRAMALNALVVEQTAGSRELLAASEGTYQQMLAETEATMQDLTETIGRIFLPLVNGLLGRVKPLLESFRNWIDNNKELARNLTLAALAVSGLVAAIGFLGLALPHIIDGFIALKGAVAFLFTNPIGLALLAIAGAAVLVWKNWDKIKPVVDRAINAFKLFWDLIKPLREFVVNQFKAAWDDLTSAFADIKRELEPFMPQLRILAMILGGAVLAAILAGVGALVVLTAIVGGVIVAVARFIGWLARLQAWTIRVGREFRQGLAAGLNLAVSLFRSIPGRVMAALSRLPSMMFAAGRGLLSALASGIRAAAAGPINAVAAVVGKIRDLLPGSDAKTGPLSDLMKSGVGFAERFAEGIEKGMDTAVKAGREFSGEIAMTRPGFENSPVKNETSINRTTNINVNFTGVFTGNEKDMRRLAERVFRAEADVASMNGMSLSEKVARA